MPGESSSHVTHSVRRLAAIMSADIAGYSRLMSQDEEGTHARMTRYRRDIVEPTIAEHHGTIVKHMGDGFLAVFDSPLEATRCAIVVQQTIAARNAALSDRSNWLQYRIGINLGDVMVEPSDVFGDGVNVAARLQTAAKPGDVNISGGIYEQVKNKLVCGYQSLGDERLKNITDPVRIYRVLPDRSAVEKAEHRSRRFARALVPMLAACSLAFAVGVWYAARRNAVESSAVAVAPGSGEPSAAWSSPPPRAPAAPAPPAQGPPPEPPRPEPPRSETAREAPRPEAAPSPPAPNPAPPVSVAAAAPPAPVASPTPAPPANALRDCQGCPELLRLPRGTYLMGNAAEPSERPVRQVAVAPFALGRSPVTRAEWRACVDAGACRFDPGGSDDLPVRNVSWDDAQQYVTWLARVTARPYRLPSEAEWEYAARAGTATSYWWGSGITPGVANCRVCGTPYDPSKPIRIELLRPNPLGLHGMGGGVSEWVSDCWHASYHGAPRTGSWDAPLCREHVLRGGSWLSDPEDIRVSSRARYDTGVRYPAHGFRVALTTD